MNRVYHRRVCVSNIACVVVVALLAMGFLLQRTGGAVAVGLALMAFIVVSIERFVHTTYTLTHGGQLVIDRGRFSRKTVLMVADISKAYKMEGRMLMPEHVVVEYGKGRMACMMPDEADSMLHEIRLRQAVEHKEGIVK